MQNKTHRQKSRKGALVERAATNGERRGRSETPQGPAVGQECALSRIGADVRVILQRVPGPRAACAGRGMRPLLEPAQRRACARELGG
eukprot:gene13817-biopygen18583